MRSILAILLVPVLLTMGITAPKARARPAKCLLQVDGHNYIDRICNFDADKDGSFRIGTDETPMTFFAYVNKNDDGTMDASWNGTSRESHADERLGTLRRDTHDPACWVNAKATICAW